MLDQDDDQHRQDAVRPPIRDAPDEVRFAQSPVGQKVLWRDQLGLVELEVIGQVRHGSPQHVAHIGDVRQLFADHHIVGGARQIFHQLAPGVPYSFAVILAAARPKNEWVPLSGDFT